MCAHCAPCLSARLFLCARCRQQVVLCSRCDRGNRYCGPTCAQRARHDAQRAAARRYQSSRRGRHTHAARQARYRRRQREKVTHQGSPPRPSDQCSCENTPTPIAVAEPVAVLNPAAVADDAQVPEVPCHRCGCECSPLLRQGFLRRPQSGVAGRDP
ncbi:hypothetical protein Thiosp_03859 [Thiorhodovibrio litoralis]|nr:hypothetical protein Thiosp_00086 [Thiorhodovibrio litoralis]WPL12195.1 hypothetical protein Thiosp_01955 [Thiorhodovibrio litoralis]WPL12841.1 hypothetical protein Thiosp_02620 [Thiorhodovibrio litoralis]WPL13675.1 hypothetical protein Thiosp_03490 [Thiorhodovibrio litoralis]WPL13822.1 hypothetical protein Thiosp_03642 [Thiorhodovibrio litoralis]